MAGLSAAVAVVAGVGAASAAFVDYLADRAQARTAVAAPAQPATPVTLAEAGADAAGAQPKVAARAPAEAPPPVPVKPAPAEIEVALPSAAAIAKVAAAVGPEHAIELPAADPTAEPIVQIEEPAETVDVAVLEPEPLALADEETQTGAIPAARDIAPEILKPKKAVPPGKAQEKAAAAQKAAEPETEVASLPGVDIGGLAGNPSADSTAAGTVRTVTKPAAANRGGVPAGGARVTTAVNMRSSAAKGASVVGVVPAGATVNVLSCDGWCEVVYGGRKGWVYKSFLSAGQPQQKAAAAPKPKAAQPQQKAAAAPKPKTADAPAQDEAEAAPPGRKIPSSRL